jgi:acetyl esterase/lipase
MDYQLKPVTISTRSRIFVWLLRKLLRPWMTWVMRGPIERIIRMQLLTASRACRNTCGLPLEYRPVDHVPGYVLGNLTDTHKSVILYIHGGAFLLPASPDVHVRMVAKMCKELDAVGFVVDYRLAPGSKFPASLDDCERAYRSLLDRGFAPSRIVIAGESAGGNLTLGLLQRIRKHGWPMPACAVPISPATEMARLYGLPSRTAKMKQDPILPISVMYRVHELYVGDWDSSDPELSPLYADLKGFPPLYLLASDNEILLDDTLQFVQRAREAGIATQMDIWPTLPHAFPLFEQMFPEVREARKDIVAFMRAHVT